MLLYILAIFCISSTTRRRTYSTANSVLDEFYYVVDGNSDELRWADTYSVKATRISLISKIVEDVSAWKTNHSSRVDYNKGAFKVIANLAYEDNSPIKYEIHPETTEEELNKIACHVSFEVVYRNYTALDEILPSLQYEEYEAVANETIDDVVVTKFEYTAIRNGEDIRSTIFATYSEDIGWIPVKYDVQKYSTLLGALIQHDIWSFFEYRTDEIDDDIFDTDKYGCEESNTVTHTIDSEGVTKELLFINPDYDEHVDHVFNHFKTKFNREYAHEKEHSYRKAIFEKNLRIISSVNKKNLSYKLGVNQFTDKTPEEKQWSLGVPSHHGGLKRPEVAAVPFPYTDTQLEDELDDLPKEYDMRLLGLVSPVKDQSDCGSCWTFAAAAVMEGALARINGGRVLSLSNQAIIDCAYDDLAEFGAGGCNGGFDYVAYNFIAKHGLPTVEEYGPYTMRDGYCNIGNMTKLYSIEGYTQVTKYSANAMKVALVNHGPLYVYVHISYDFFMYSRGIFYESSESCNTERPNHAVAIVGYGEEDGEQYFIMKNSYGHQWGEDGYMRISARDNVCGVASNPTYPIMKY